MWKIVTACFRPVTWPRSLTVQVNSPNMKLLSLWDNILGQVSLVLARRVWTWGTTLTVFPNHILGKDDPLMGVFWNKSVTPPNILTSCSLKPVFPEHWQLPVKSMNSQDVQDAGSGSLWLKWLFFQFSFFKFYFPGIQNKHTSAWKEPINMSNAFPLKLPWSHHFQSPKEIKAQLKRMALKDTT